jgi:threonylcarbamoyladenosine tRNA methylthiotransferase MtaB
MIVNGTKILPHFHIPLQSGCNKILGLMRRRYKREEFAARIDLIREKLPLAGIGADIIVGFPGESSDDFEDTFSFLEKQPLSYLHVFTFSERPGTIAEKLNGKIQHQKKNQGVRDLLLFLNKKDLNFTIEILEWSQACSLNEPGMKK